MFVANLLLLNKPLLQYIRRKNICHHVQLFYHIIVVQRAKGLYVQ